VLPLQAAVAQRSASGRELARPSEDDIDGGKNCRESPARDCKRASVQGVALNDENWSAKIRSRSNGLTEVGPSASGGLRPLQHLVGQRPANG